MPLTLANRLNLPALAGRQPHWLAVDALSRTAFFRYDFTTARHAENGRPVSWPGGWTQERASAAYYSTSAGALIAASDDVMRVSHFDVDEMARVLLMEKGTTNLMSGDPDYASSTGVIVGSPSASRGFPFAYNLVAPATGDPGTNLVVYNESNGRFPVASGLTYTMKYWFVPGDEPFIQVTGSFATFGTNQWTTVNCATGEVVNTGADSSATARLVGDILEVSHTVTASADGHGVAAIAFTDGQNERTPTLVNYPGGEITALGTNVVVGDYVGSFVLGEASRDDDNLYRDMTAFDASGGIVMQMKFNMGYRGDDPSPRAWQLGVGGGDQNRKTLYLSDTKDTLSYLGMSSDLTRNTFDLPYVIGDVVDVAVRNTPGVDGFAFIADGILGLVADCAEYTESDDLHIAASTPGGASKPQDLRVLEVGAWADGGVTNEQLIDTTAPVKSVKQIEGVTPLLDLWFEEQAYSINGKARGLSNILSHERASEAYGLLSDGRIASHPDDYPRLTFETGARAHVAEASIENLSDDIPSMLKGSNTTLTHLPNEVGPDGLVGGVYRLQLPASADTYIRLATLTYSTKHTGAVYVKSGGAGLDDFGFVNALVGDIAASAGAEWTRLFASFEAGEAFTLNNGDDSYAVNILIAFPMFNKGELSTFVEPGTTRAADLNRVDLTPLAGQLDDIWLLFDGRLNAVDNAFSRLVQLGENSDRLPLFHHASSGTLRAEVWEDDINQMTSAGVSYSFGDRARIAVRFALGESAAQFVSASGVISRTIGSRTVPSILYLGQSDASGGAKPESMNTNRVALMRGPDFSTAQAQSWIGALS